MTTRKTVEDYRREIVRRAIEAREQAETPKPADVGVRFAKTKPSLWNGNGFGTSTAEWVALMGDVEVGRYERDGYVADVFGDNHFGSTSVTRWKRSILRIAAKGL
jgi:hypothetical protein